MLFDMLACALPIDFIAALPAPLARLAPALAPAFIPAVATFIPAFAAAVPIEAPTLPTAAAIAGTTSTTCCSCFGFVNSSALIF